MTRRVARSGPRILTLHHPAGQVILVAALVAAGLLVRLWFLDGRWINPDEGAHLMNGFLVLEGYVPGVDFHARQPLYGYFLGGVMALVGVDYQVARLYPIMATLAIGVFVYLIAARLFGARVAVVAAAIYLFIPFTVVYGTHVKTEPLTILLSSVGIYLLLLAMGRRGPVVPAMLAGGCFALAYYTRQSALAMLLVGLVALLLAFRDVRPLARGGTGLVAGFVLVCVAVMAAYASMLPTREVLTGPLNPAAFVVDQVRPLLSGLGESGVGSHGVGGDGSGEPAPSPTQDERVDQPWSVTVGNVLEAIQLNSVLVMGLLLSPLPLARNAGHTLRGTGRRRERAALLLWVWVAAVAAAYGFYAVVRGFFPAYFGELLPPLAILTALVGVHAMDRLRGRDRAGPREFWIVAGTLAGAALLHGLLGAEAIHRPLYFLGAPVVVAVLFLSRTGAGLVSGVLAGSVVAGLGVLTIRMAGAWEEAAPLLYAGALVLAFAIVLTAFRVNPRQTPRQALAFAAFSLLVASALLWTGASQARLDRTYDGVWPPQVVAEVTEYLSQRTTPRDAVLSGAVIWEVQAQRIPFMRVSHPLAFRPGMDSDQRLRMEAALERTPPAVVIMDGYTEQTYVPNLPAFPGLLAERYRLARVVDGARYPVRIYERGPATVADPGTADAFR